MLGQASAGRGPRTPRRPARAEAARSHDEGSRTAPHEVPSIEALYTRRVEVGRNIGFMTARVGKLLDLYGAETLTQAVATVLVRGLHDPGALALLCEEARRRAGRPMPALLELGA